MAQPNSSSTFLLGGQNTAYLSPKFSNQLFNKVSASVVRLSKAVAIGHDSGVIQRVGSGALFNQPCRMGTLIRKPTDSITELVLLFAKPIRKKWVFQDLFPQMPPSLDAFTGHTATSANQKKIAKGKSRSHTKSNTSPPYFLSQQGCEDSLWVFVYNPGATTVPAASDLLAALGSDKENWQADLAVATDSASTPNTGFYFLGGFRGQHDWNEELLAFFPKSDSAAPPTVLCELTTVNSLPSISAWSEISTRPHTFGPCTLENLRLRLTSPTTFGLSGTQIEILATCSLDTGEEKAKRAEWDVEIDWPLNEDRVMVRGTYNQPGLPFNAADSLPFARSKSSRAKGGKELDLELIISKSTKRLLLASFTAKFDQWRPLPHFDFELRSLNAAVTVIDPAESKSMSAQISANASLGSKGTQLSCSGIYPGGMIHFSLASKNGLSLKVLIGDLFGSAPKWIPSLKLKDLRGSYDPTRKDVSLEVDLQGDWRISSSPQLTLTEIRFRVDQVKSPSFSLSATCLIAGSEVSISGEFINNQFTFAVGTHPGDLTLVDLMNFLDPGLIAQLPAGLEKTAQIALDNFHITYDTAKKKLISFELSVRSDETWKIPGLEEFGVDKLRLKFEGMLGPDGKLTLGGRLAGEIKFGEAAGDRLQLSATKSVSPPKSKPRRKPASGKHTGGASPSGWLLTGSIPGPVHLGAIAQRMAKVSGQTLQGQVSQKATLSHLDVSIDTTQKQFQICGAVSTSMSLTLGATEHSFDFVLAASYRAEPTATKRSSAKPNSASEKSIFEIKLKSDLTLGDSRFDVEIDLNSSTLQLNGKCSGKSKVLSLAGLAQSLGVPYDIKTPAGINLGLTEASFTFDAGHKTLSVSALSRYGTASIHVSQDLGGTWGITAGVVVKDLSKLPGAIGTAVSRLGMEHDEGLLLASSIDGPTFKMAGFTPPAGSPLVLQKGIAFCFVADLTSSKKSSTQWAHLSSITGTDTLLIQAHIASLRSIQFSAALSDSITLAGSGTNTLTLTDPMVSLDTNPFGITLGGEIEVPVESDSNVPLNARALLEINPEGLQADFNIALGTDGVCNPNAMTGVGIDSLGGTIGLEFEPPSLELGLEGTFHLAGQEPSNDRIAFILGLEGEVPTPILILCQIQEITVSEIFESCTSKSSTQLPSMLNDIRASDVMIYWADKTIVLPDGTTAQPGFAFGATVMILDFEARAALSISPTTGISGNAELSPIKIGPGDGGIVRITGKGKGLPLTDQKDSQHQRIKKGSILPAGGPFLRLNTQSSPYLQMSWDVELFDSVKQTVDVVISKQGFDCQLSCSIGTAAHFYLDVILNQQEGFKSSAGFDFALNTQLGPFNALEIPIPRFQLDVSLSLNIELDIGDKFLLALWGTFDFEGWNLTIPRLEIRVPLKSLNDLASHLIKHLEEQAEVIFHDIFDEAQKAWNAVKDEAGKIGAAAEAEAQKIGAAAEHEAQRIEKSAQHLGKQIVSLAHNAEAAAKEAEAQTAQIAAAAAADVAKIAAAAKETADQILAESKQLLDDADKFADQVAHQAAKDLKELQDDLASINQAIKTIENSIANECQQAASAIEKAAQKDIAALNREAQRILDGLDKDLKKLGKELEKVAEALKKLAKEAEHAVAHAWNALTGWL